MKELRLTYLMDCVTVLLCLHHGTLPPELLDLTGAKLLLTAFRPFEEALVMS